jgi:predicted component of type VI protein secretion system
VQLLDRTVSRTHARMTWSNERWTLENLSRTNPLSLNGAVVAEGGPPVTLGEGDRIDMGAVIFVFRER